jgi:AcrR family transcriptional regulator
MEPMPRPYTQRNRAVATARTRARLIDAAVRLIRDGRGLPIDEVAREAGVAVQTVYSQFGSKRGLLLATIERVQRDAGLYVDFVGVWSSPDGETALRRMVAATFGLWDRAWPFVEFAMGAARIDPDLAAQMRIVDSFRHEHLWLICRRLAEEGRLARDRGPEWAADLSFAMTVPAVYEELVRVRAWQPERAAADVADAVIRAVIRPGSRVADVPPPDWSEAIAISPGIAKA